MPSKKALIFYIIPSLLFVLSAHVHLNDAAGGKGKEQAASEPSSISGNDDTSSGNEMFSLSEMKTLYEKAKLHFDTSSGSQMVPIQYIYREKSPEYFQEIKARGGDQIMESHEKNGSGHPQCPIVVEQLKGLYFSTFVERNGKLPTSSLFGGHRISVSADYFLRPKGYSLYFADFYCAKYSGDVHYITLVLAERGSVEDRFCQQHLIRLNMRDNPLLYKEREQCFVVKKGNDKIYLFHAANLNISKCQTARKCTFSRVELIGNGVMDSKLVVGQTYDDRCSVCGIREKNDDNNYDAMVGQLDSMSLATSSSGSSSTANAESWRLWNFDCPDRTSSKDLWAKSLKPSEHFFRDKDLCLHYYLRQNLPVNLIDVLKWPSQMAKEIYNNREKLLGIALFRDGIVPDGDSPTRHNGGYFCMYLYTSTGNGAQLATINQIFHAFVSLALQEIPFSILDILKSDVSGIFVRANISHIHGKSAKQYNNNPGDLPCRFTFEIWIEEKERKDKFWPALNKWTAEQGKKFGMTLTFGFKK